MAAPSDTGRLAGLLQPDAGAAPKKKPPSRPVMIALNVVMFAVTAFVCFMLVRGVRSFATGRPDDAGYVLASTRMISAGERLSMENVAWRRITGRAPAGVVLGKSPKDDVAVYTASTRIGEGKLVRAALVSRAPIQAAQIATPLAGYVLTGAEISNVAPFLHVDDKVDVLALSLEDGATPRVATVVADARVTAFAAGGGGRSLRAPSAVIGVTDSQARLLTLLSRSAMLHVVLAPMRAGAADMPDGAWRDRSDLGMPAATPAFAASEPLTAPTPRAAPAAAPAAKVEADVAPAESVRMITPSGVTQTALPG